MNPEKTIPLSRPNPQYLKIHPNSSPGNLMGMKLCSRRNKVLEEDSPSEEKKDAEAAKLLKCSKNIPYMKI